MFLKNKNVWDVSHLLDMICFRSVSIHPNGHHKVNMLFGFFSMFQGQEAGTGTSLAPCDKNWRGDGGFLRCPSSGSQHGGAVRPSEAAPQAALVSGFWGSASLLLVHPSFNTESMLRVNGWFTGDVFWRQEQFQFFNLRGDTVLHWDYLAEAITMPLLIF